MSGNEWSALAQLLGVMGEASASFQRGFQQAQQAQPPKKVIPGPVRGPCIKEAVVLDIRDGEDDPEDV